jgi:hypothetical protein
LADVKISGLPASTVPLAGTEVLPIVQGGATKQVSVNNLTTGKAVSALSVTATNLKTSPTTANLDLSGTTVAATGTDANIDVNINAKGTGVAYLNQRWGVNASGALVAASNNTYDIGNGAADPRDISLGRNLVAGGTGKFGTTIGVGAATPSASGAGITFPATQSASSDANTLDDYEEGTFTPTQGGGLTVVGAFSSSGTYTKIGKQVIVQVLLNGATSIACTANGGILFAGLPFTVSGQAIGGLTNSNNISTNTTYLLTTTMYNNGIAVASSLAIIITASYLTT